MTSGTVLFRKSEMLRRCFTRLGVPRSGRGLFATAAAARKGSPNGIKEQPMVHPKTILTSLCAKLNWKPPEFEYTHTGMVSLGGLWYGPSRQGWSKSIQIMTWVISIDPLFRSTPSAEVLRPRQAHHRHLERWRLRIHVVQLLEEDPSHVRGFLGRLRRAEGKPFSILSLPRCLQSFFQKRGILVDHSLATSLESISSSEPIKPPVETTSAKIPIDDVSQLVERHPHLSRLKQHPKSALQKLNSFVKTSNKDYREPKAHFHMMLGK